MYRVTTPTHTFKLPMETSTLLVIQVVYKQQKTKLKKQYQNNTLPDGMTLEGKNVVIRLTQEETKQFVADDYVKTQIRVLTNAGDAYASKTFSIYVNDVLDEEILFDD